jgi:hypothetical protein
MSTTDTRPVTAAAAAPAPRLASRWTAGRVIGVSLASAAVLGGVALTAVAAGVHVVDEQHREGGYLTTDTTRVSSSGHAVTVEEIDLDGLSGDWLLGTARLRVTAAGDSDLFVGVAPADEVDDYLAGVDHTEVVDLDATKLAEHVGGAPDEAPTGTDIWTAQVSGPGTQTLTWKPSDGDWAVVVMNQDAAAGVDVRADVGATVPILPDAARWLLVGGSVAAVGGGFVLLTLLIGARRRTAGAR